MADILDFRPTEGKSGRRNGGAHSAGCEIVIFPGVRYEHWERQAAQPAQTQEKQKAGRKRVKRDRLEVMD